MHATVYGRGQMVIPADARKQAGIRKGDVLSVQPEGEGRLLLVRLEKPDYHPRQVRITHRKGTHPTGTVGRPIDTQEVKALLADFP
jgi:AbrB family looped-hinge helix DNA binding protein